ncbi:hypothetical protein CDQ84_17105 [Clostridium thermosuccinogenes]|uniref:Uncharacterized protein n=1 Tax=Clostridium thermosuccinogenes TaxID=84032 RepID=A0A2K2F7Q3_9CLOT|nr:hypothetical protein CDO33_03400 [Pseudoclostridium thermosuccinogenes]PNT94800.1 hypothetical protein CDQ85_17005 [Pseudoclostridium thermosuccinogenes]PNT95428.1 hypothetical protein CDQ84_17105 [Pseudoclostridium thermosuccinogenes]
MSAYYHTEEKKYIKTTNHPELAGWNGKITVLGAKKNYYSNSFLCMNVPIKNIRHRSVEMELIIFLPGYLRIHHDGQSRWKI